MDRILRQAQLIQGALSIGVLVFAQVLYWVYSSRLITHDTGSAQPLALLRILSFINVAFFIFGWSIGPFMRFLLNKNHTMSPESRWLTGRLVTLAPREGSAFLGLTVCFLGVQNGQIYNHPIFWWNSLSAVLMLLYATISFPTHDRLSREIVDGSGVPPVIR